METQYAKERGFVLASALIILASLTLIIVTVAHRNTSNELMSSNQRDSINAMTIAESGVEAGFALVRRDFVKQRQFLITDLAPYSSSPMLNDGISGGDYTVTIPVIDANYIVMNSIGNVAGAEREIEIILEIDANATFQYAILTEDDIDALEGQPQITGPYANIHSNSDIYIQGNPTVTGTVSASGNVSANGNPDIGAVVSGASLVEIPHVYPPEYEQFATVVFSPDCLVLTPAGAQIADLSSGGRWRGWDCSVNQKWIMSGNVHADLFEGFYYVKGNVSIEGNPNGTWYVSIVAEGNIEVSGNSDFRPWGSKPGNNTGDHSANEILFLAGNDLKVVGTPDQSLNGILAAHMEIHISGNPSIAGSIVAENGKHAMGQEVTSGQAVVDIVTANEVQGSMAMDASGTAVIGGGNPVKVNGWRELVH